MSALAAAALLLLLGRVERLPVRGADPAWLAATLRELLPPASGLRQVWAEGDALVLVGSEAALARARALLVRDSEPGEPVEVVYLARADAARVAAALGPGAAADPATNAVVLTGPGRLALRRRAEALDR